MNKSVSSKNLSDFLNRSLHQGREILEQIIPDKKILQKYEKLLAHKLHDLTQNQKLEELIKPIRKKLEESCVKPLEAKNLNEFSQRVMSVLRVQAKRQSKRFEKKTGIKVLKRKPSSRRKKRTAP